MATTETAQILGGRPTRKCAQQAGPSAIARKGQAKEREREVKAILAKPVKSRSREEKRMLRRCKDVAKVIERRARLKEMVKRKTQEVEDGHDVLEVKIDELVKAIQQSQHLVVYTGAGISTAASIPDYRGPNGVWTLLQMGQEVKTKSLVDADPTQTHMALRELYEQGLVQHIVSQNCDGLHLRSGFPQRALSEIHGNMFIEVCRECAPERQYVRLFDVTERTACRRHGTGRECAACGAPLGDSIVHFGEKGSLQWPLNWSGAAAAAAEADTILCLGSSLKVLKRYSCLWGTTRTRSKQPKLYIINLQWTPKDKMAALKIHGRCDEVMQRVMSKLELQIPEYERSRDPIFALATPLRKAELGSFTTKLLQQQQQQEQEQAGGGLNRNGPVGTGPGRRLPELALQCSGADSSKVKLEPSPEDRDGRGAAGTVTGSGSAEERDALLTLKPGWFGKGFHRKPARSRKRRKTPVDTG